MAEDTIDQAVLVAGLQEKPCVTEDLRIHGWLKNVDMNNHLHVYGSDRVGIDQLKEENPELGEQIHPDLPYIKAEIIWAIRNEMAITIDDVLSRRTRMLLLDAQAALESAELVAEYLAQELDKDQAWVKQEVAEFNALAKEYTLT